MSGPEPVAPAATVNDNDEQEDSLPGSDDELPETTAGGPATNWVEKRRAQKAILETWITSSAGRNAIKSKTNKGGRTKEEVDEQQSIHSLLAQQQKGSQIVKNPREYQIELFERAKTQNTIAVLDTGSGKTLIAVLLLRWTIDNELESRAAGNPSKISFFLVASVTLVYQQFSVLQCNLDHNVTRLSGADGVDRWNAGHWRKVAQENKVVVCTADILLQCLSRSYLSMKQINLLVFDEAHHTKKNHAYARIVKDFYLAEDAASRPRVFGMTASPIDAKTDVMMAASELEALLNSKIATTQDMSLTNAIKRPQEFVMSYAALPQEGYETALLQSLKDHYGHIEVLKKILTRARDVAQQLGRWCTDMFLLESLSTVKLKALEVGIEKQFHRRQGEKAVRELDDALQEIREAIDYTQLKGSAATSTIDSGDLSSKVLELKSYLELQFERPANHRCIVFVRQRYAARVLRNLFQRLQIEHMRSHFLVGSNNGGVTEESFTFRQQVFTLLKFRKGELNCLFSTSVAEEGLDVPDCNLVIRFDMYNTMIEYVQSRGRARSPNSKFIHMVESGNPVHHQLLADVRAQEATMRQYCNVLPEDRMLHGNQDNLEALLEKEKGLRSSTDPTTGAKLTYGNALGVLANFVSAIPTESDEPQHPTFVVSARKMKFVAEVILPENSPIRSVVGQECTRMSLAKRSVAFDACLELRKKNHLDGHFMPTYQKKLPALRNALLAVGMKAKSGYEALIKPTIWTKHRGIVPTELWLTIIDFPNGLEKPHQPLALLTRTAMPHFPEFLVYLNNGRGTPVVSVALHEPLSLDNDDLSKLTRFTFRMFEDVFSKKYEEDVAKLSYWIAPATLRLFKKEAKNERLHLHSPKDALDWALLDEVFSNDEYPWTPQTPGESLANRFLVDKWDGSRKFYSLKVDPTRKATDPIPAGVAKSKLTGTILDYSVSLWKRARQEREADWSRTQPVMEAEKIVLRRNLLAPPEQKEVVQSTIAFLCPQPLRISPLTPAIATSCLTWPAIIHRLEAYLISIEGCDSIGLECQPSYALAAFTKDSDNQGEHGQEEQVNFQHGMGENYERLEFIGDTFLKTATTISTFIMNPNENEFEFHVRRMLMLCNKNLFETALELKLFKYIRSSAFSRREWYPEGLKLLVGTGVTKGEEKEMFLDPKIQDLGEKTIADVSEALIGAAYLSHDQVDAWQPDAMDSAVRMVTKLVNSPDHTMMKWDDYRTAYIKPSYQTADVTAVQKDLAQKVEREHLYRFTHPRLLYSAFLHPSMPFIYEKMPNYQRLEFLGDALLDQASITYLFYKYPDKDPQWLTEHKMAMVSNKFLGALCVIIGFHKHLRHHHPQMEHQIREYATELLTARQDSGGSRDYWTTVSDPPKSLPDILEAFIGAMFIDSNFDFREVRRFFDTHVRWFFEDMSLYDTFANNHPCTHLHNLLQTTFGCVDYRLMVKELPSVDSVERTDIVAVVMVHDKIIAHSTGKSGRNGRLRAANLALEVLDGFAPFDYRARFECDCKVDAEGMKPGSGDHGMGYDCAI